MSKPSWMGHGAWMGIIWVNMEDGCMGLKHNSQNVTCFSGDMFWGLKLLEHRNMCKAAHQNLTCFNGW
jgi:hypothetical protein